MGQPATHRKAFVAPNYVTPVILDQVLSHVPQTATAKGFYFRALLREAEQAGQYLKGFGPYREFNDYPVAEAAALLLQCAERMYPLEPKGEGLRRLGWIIFPTLLQTMVGRVVFGALGNDILSVLRHAHRGFEVSLASGRCRATGLFEREGVLEVREFHLFPEHFLVGVFEGVLAHYGFDGGVTWRPLSPVDADYRLTW